MKFTDLLKTAVLLSMGGATLLAVVTVVAATDDLDDALVVYGAGWWFVAGLLGGWLGRERDTLPAIATVLADSRAATMMPDIRPWAVTVNRLWPMLVAVLLAGGIAFLAPSVPMIATGFFVIWALYWRNQALAVTAIEERDGVVFFVERTSPVAPVKLVRTPGLRRETPELPA